MPDIAPRCHELRIVDEKVEWRIIYRIDSDAVVILEVFEKKTKTTSRDMIDVCRKRLTRYELQGRERA